MSLFHRSAIGAACLLILFTVAGMYGRMTDLHPRYHKLMAAIDRNDLAAVKSQIEAGTNPSDFPPQNADEDDIAPLCAAVSDGHQEMVTLLLDHGADINVMDGWNSMPLELAARANDIPMMNLLISRGAKINDQPDGGSWALYGAAVEDKVEAVKLLLSHGANANTGASAGTVLSVVESFHYNDVALLLKQAGAREGTMTRDVKSQRIKK